MEQTDVIPLNIYIGRIQNIKQNYTFIYGEVCIDEERKAVKLENTHDEDLKESLHKKGIDIQEDDFLIPLKRSKKQLWLPSYIPMRMLDIVEENLVCYKSEENTHVILMVKGNPLECIKKYTEEI